VSEEVNIMIIMFRTLFRDYSHDFIVIITIAWFGLAWFGLAWFGLAWFGLVWIGICWYCLISFGLDWLIWPCSILFGLIWYGPVWSAPQAVIVIIMVFSSPLYSHA